MHTMVRNDLLGCCTALFRPAGQLNFQGLHNLAYAAQYGGVAAVAQAYQLQLFTNVPVTRFQHLGNGQHLALSQRGLLSPQVKQNSVAAFGGGEDLVLLEEPRLYSVRFHGQPLPRIGAVVDERPELGIGHLEQPV